MQRAEVLFPRKGVDTAVATVVTECRSDRVVDRCGGVVFDCESEQSDRHRRVTVVVRYERAERRHAHSAWKVGLMELKLGHRKTSDECDVVEMGNSRHGIAISAETESVEFADARRTGRCSLIRAVENSSAQQLAVPFRLDRKVAVTIELIDRRPVADAPVDEPAATCQ
jgi:hypothetical protein